MATQAREPTKEAEIRVSNPSLWYNGYAICGHTFECYAQAFHPKLTEISYLSFNQYPVFLPIFLARFQRFFMSCKSNKNSIFLLVPSLSLRGFSSIKPPIFFLIFSSSLIDFFTNWTHGFFLSFSLGLRDFFLLNPWSKTLHDYRSFHLKRNAIVMSWGYITSHVIDLTRSKQFHISQRLISHYS